MRMCMQRAPAGASWGVDVRARAAGAPSEMLAFTCRESSWCVVDSVVEQARFDGESSPTTCSRDFALPEPSRPYVVCVIVLGACAA